MTSLISGFLIVKSGINNIAPELLGECSEVPYEKCIDLVVMEDVYRCLFINMTPFLVKGQSEFCGQKYMGCRGRRPTSCPVWVT